jgi:transcriptional regulator with XRE-family HTH domain
MAAPQSPLGSRRRLGAELRKLRSRAGLTLDDVAERMTCSTSKISRLETGKGIPKIPDVRELMRIYGVVSEGDQDELLQLVHDGREHGWWEPLVEDVPTERFVLEAPGRYAALESDATQVCTFDLTVVYGLLQTTDYARAVRKSFLLHHSASEIDSLLELRVKRQEALRRTDPPPVDLLTVMDEAVLYREIGGAAIMAAQLAALVEATAQPNVSVRILPFGAGLHRAHAGHFVILEIPAELGSDVVFVESHAGSSYLDDTSAVAHYGAVHAEAVSAALSPGESRELIAARLAEYRGRAEPAT